MKKAFPIFLVLLMALGALATVWRWLGGTGGRHLAPAEILGGVVRGDDAAGGRLYYLTSQWEKRVSHLGTRSSSGKTIGWLNVDLWELDAATARPISRRRIKREKVNADAKAMGLEQGVLWARIPELVGIRVMDGAIVVDREKIEARNPGLAGLIPKPPGTAFFLTESMQPLKFDPQAGLIIRLDDARQVRIDPLTLEATPYIPRRSSEDKRPARSEESPQATRQEMISPSQGMDWYAMVRGIRVQGKGDGLWLGLLSESELEEMRERKITTGQMNFSVPQRHRLYRAELEKVEEFLGPRLQYVNPAPLAESPEFLMAGLLTAGPGGSGEQSALWRREPDSVFVISRDRLGEDGRLRLARISGPAGKPVWSIALPLSQMSAWIPGKSHALMLGPNPSAPRSPMAEKGENPVLQIVSINLASGELNTFNPDLQRDFPVTGEEKR